jgi:hypothetical protein
MSSSTPINQIRHMSGGNSIPSQNSMPPSQLAQTDEQLMNDILREMGSTPGEDNVSDMNSESFQHMMDHSQVPPEKMLASKFDDMALDMDEQIDSQLDDDGKYHHKDNKRITHSFNNDDGFSGITNLSLNTNNIKHRIWNFVKMPIIVFILCFILGLPQVNRFIFSMLPYLLLESGQISIWGNLLKCSFLVVLMMIIQYFI